MSKLASSPIFHALLILPDGSAISTSAAFLFFIAVFFFHIRAEKRMPAGVCAVVKSKPRRVQRCVSNGSLDVKGSVVVERVWLTDGGRFCCKSRS